MHEIGGDFGGVEIKATLDRTEDGGKRFGTGCSRSYLVRIRTSGFVLHEFDLQNNAPPPPSTSPAPRQIIDML